MEIPQVLASEPVRESPFSGFRVGGQSGKWVYSSRCGSREQSWGRAGGRFWQLTGLLLPTLLCPLDPLSILLLSLLLVQLPECVLE